MLEKQLKKYRRHKRVRAKIKGTVKVPRLCVFRSAKYIYAQLIDDNEGKTLVAVDGLEIKKPPKSTATVGPAKKAKIKDKKEEKIIRTGKIYIAYEVGKKIAQKALEKKIEKIVFDRGGYKYHGRVKALAEGAREGGLQF